MEDLLASVSELVGLVRNHSVEFVKVGIKLQLRTV
jgi:hypothetical protein